MLRNYEELFEHYQHTISLGTKEEKNPMKGIFYTEEILF